MDQPADALAEYREAARKKYWDRKRKENEQKLQEKIEFTRQEQLEHFRQWQLDSLQSEYGLDEDTANRLLWSDEDVEEILMLPSENMTTEQEKALGALYMIKLRSHDATVFCFDIRELIHLVQVQDRAPPYHPGRQGETIGLRDWSRVAARWSKVGAHAVGVQAQIPFSRVAVQASNDRVVSDLQDPNGADVSTNMRLMSQYSGISKSAQYGAFYVGLPQELYEWYAGYKEHKQMESAQETPFIVVEIVTMIPGRFNSLYLPVGNPERSCPTRRAIELHPVLLRWLKIRPGAEVQIRVVSLPAARAAPQIAVRLMPLGGDHVDLRPEHFKHTLEQHKTLQSGQVIWVYRDPAHVFESAKAFLVDAVWNHHGMYAPCVIVYNRDIGVDFKEASAEFSRLSCHDAVNKWFTQCNN